MLSIYGLSMLIDEYYPAMVMSVTFFVLRLLKLPLGVFNIQRIGSPIFQQSREICDSMLGSSEYMFLGLFGQCQSQTFYILVHVNQFYDPFSPW